VTAIFASYGVVSLVLRRSPFVRRIL
jgi:hypothetical protein